MKARARALELAVLALAALAGCESDGWEDMPGSRIYARADGTAVEPAAWDAAVRQAAGTWNARLTQRGCEAPFVVGDTGDHEIRLVPDAAWENGAGVAGKTHDFPDERIEIREGAAPERSAVLLHEMGHAIGLVHVDASGGPSVMLASVSVGGTVEERDLVDAACLLGCGACP